MSAAWQVREVVKGSLIAPSRAFTATLRTVPLGQYRTLAGDYGGKRGFSSPGERHHPH